MKDYFAGLGEVLFAVLCALTFVGCGIGIWWSSRLPCGSVGLFKYERTVTDTSSFEIWVCNDGGQYTRSESKP